jgi:Methyltransferase FkbM domain
MLKIDVEGAEAKVLEGMTYILHGDRPKLLLEVHRHHASGEAHPAIPGAVLFLHEKGEDEPFSNASEGWESQWERPRTTRTDV